MTKEERDAVYSRCASIDNIIISMEREINMLRTHLDKLTKACEDEPQMENPCDGCVCDDGKHLMYCMNCKGIAWKTEPPKVDPQTERSE